jgi:hypothetical protein
MFSLNSPPPEKKNRATIFQGDGSVGTYSGEQEVSLASRTKHTYGPLAASWKSLN